MNSWRRSRAPAVAVVALFFAVQLVVPISRIGDHDLSQRFGWQMFAVLSAAPQFTVHTSEGSQPVDLDNYLARVRGDIDLPRLVPPFLCRAIPGAMSVTWDDERYRCPTG